MSALPVVIVGAGPAGLMAAYKLAQSGVQVLVYDHNKAPARKFLVAGHGGFNLTHSEPIEEFVHKYTHPHIQQVVKEFDNVSVIKWLDSIGIKTFVGSSGKVFPERGIKPIEVLNAWMEALKGLQVCFFSGYKLVDFDEEFAYFSRGDSIESVRYGRMILAVGGGSWSKTGSDGRWTEILSRKNVNILPFQAANSGYNTKKDFSILEGQILKNVQIRFGDIIKKGEVLFTRYGIEGSPVYYMNRYTRKENFPLTLTLDLKPSLTVEDIAHILRHSRKISETLKSKLNLKGAALTLLKLLDKETFTTADLLAKSIKNYPIEVTGLRPIEEVISTCGGVDMDEVRQDFSLVKYPKVHCIGEMLDWDAPTGGYLLQACFSMGHFCAQQIISQQDNVSVS